MNDPKSGSPTIRPAAPCTSGGPTSFAALIEEEFTHLHGNHPPERGQVLVTDSKVKNEPWVLFTAFDHLGLALSGGGIRSATFNLGLLQALARRHVLPHVDYLSTVSGGGYIGAFWTAWLHRQRLAGADPARGESFPVQEDVPVLDARGQTVGMDRRESMEVRHLREFSRFLMPRVGLSYSETWAGIVTILGGMFPAFGTAVALVALLVYGWFLCGHGLIALTTWSPWAAGLLFAAATVTLHFSMEVVWRRSGKGGASVGARPDYFVFLGLIGGAAAVGWALWGMTTAEGAEAWREATGSLVLPEFPPEMAFDRLTFGPTAVWIALAFLALFARGMISRFAAARGWSGDLDRAAARSLSLALLWAMIAFLWNVSAWLLRDTESWWQGAPGVGAVGFSALFFWFRDWLTKPVEETRASSYLGKLGEKLKPLVPQALAYLAVLLIWVASIMLLQRFGLGTWLPIGLGVATGSVLLTLFFFDPARLGMHDFYRARIARCFLGASAPSTPSAPTPTAEQPGDDIALGALRESSAGHRPLHLVCCAANNLSGDVLSNLYRGARSAVISPLGLSLGDESARYDELPLSSALTASAAAFNSHMGHVSMHLGSAVAFLMSSLNLRLGLWVPHPRYMNERKRLLVGTPFFLEMLGISHADPLPPSDAGMGAKMNETLTTVSKKASQLHLSDGGHFENLGLYELVRRHCRYVIVSDCGADPEVAFDDLANAIRRVREDFGVEIELDVGPLRPDENGYSRQHAVLGSIHYDGLGGTDKGSILYFKPTLTGDEPPDVLQYRSRNGAFPHEGTGDQFYDEAQWESYRRLGEHAGGTTLRFLEKDDPAKRSSGRFIENLFLEAGQLWRPSSAANIEVFAELNERCAALETDVRENAPDSLRAEFFPEVFAAFGQPVPGYGKPSAPADELRILYYLILVAQVMEDAWLAAELETQWSHPVNEGWMNYFQRWASTPSFRRWWPLLRPFHSPGFRDWVRNRFGIRVDRQSDPDKPAYDLGARVVLCSSRDSVTRAKGLAWQQWSARIGADALTGKACLEACLMLEGEKPGHYLEPIQVGFLLYRREGRTICWKARDFFVPPALVGAGISARLLNAAIAHFENLTGADAVDTLMVDISEDGFEHTFGSETTLSGTEAPGARRQKMDPGSRMLRVQNVGFYKSRGFMYDGGAQLGRLVRRLDGRSAPRTA